MRTVGAFEAKNHLSELLDSVEAGEEITITRHGKSVARLISSSKDQRSVRTGIALASVRALRARLAANGVCFSTEEIQTFRDEGRR